mgnify:CR=1 FL=1
MSTKKYLDLDGLSHVWLLIGNKLTAKVDKAYKTGSSSEYKVLSDNNYTDTEVTKLSGIEAGAEVNVIETVQVNGSALTPASKTVNVQIPITSVKVNGTALTPSSNAVDVTVPTAVSDLTNDGDGTSPFATQAYVGTNGGKIDVIQVNGTTQTITNKTVNISVPTNNNQLTNGAGYQTASDVSTAINTAIGGITSIDYQVVQALPASGVKGTIYLVSNSGTGTNIYDEYIWVNNAWEFIGTTAVDLSNYLQDSDVIPLTNNEIDSVCT